MRKNLISLSLGAAAMCAAATAQAASIPLPLGLGILEDDNLEYVQDSTGAIKTSGTLGVGDTLHAVIDITKTLDGASNEFFNLGASPLELTGISVIEIVAITGTGDLVFGPNSSFEATYGTGAMGVLFSQNPGDFALNCHLSGIAACETQATNGTELLTIGFGDPDDFWVAGGAGIGAPSTIDLATVAGLAGVTKVSVANYALSILENNTTQFFAEQASPLSALFGIGPPALQDGLTDVIGSGDILGGFGLTNGYIARSDFDFQVNRIPEPTTLALLGLGLAGLGYGAQRRARKSS